MQRNSEVDQTVLFGEDEVSVRDLLVILRRRWKIIAATIVLVTAPSVLYGVLRDPNYTASSRIVVEQDLQTGSGSQSSFVPTHENPENLKTEVALLRSDPNITGTMESLNLFTDPEFQVSGTKLSRAWQSFWSYSKQYVVAGSTQPPSAGLSADELKRIAVEEFNKRLEVVNVEKTSVIEIAFSSSSAEKAAAVANQLAQGYLKERLDRKAAAVEKANLSASVRLQEQRKLLLDAENLVAQIMSDRQFMPDRGPVLSTTNLEALNQEIGRTAAEIVKRESTLAAIDKLQAAGSRIETAGPMITSPVLEQLRRQEVELSGQVAQNTAVYGRRDRRTIALKVQMTALQDRINEEAKRIVDGMRLELDSLKAQKFGFEDQLNLAKGASGADTLAAVRLHEAERDVAAKRAVYEELLQQQQKSGMIAEALAPGARIISAAEVPTSPDSIGLASIASIGFVLSSLLGGGLALIRDQADKKLRSRRQLERVLQLPCLALLPMVQPATASSPRQDPGTRVVNSAYAQAVRKIYAHLDLGGKGTKSVFVASSLPNEGKTRLAVDLAICASQLGKRTLLVDFDVYRPMVMREFGAQIFDSPGTAARSASTAVSNVNQALVIEQSTGVHILSVRSNRHEAAPNLGPQQIRALLEPLRRRYDFIVIDSSPLLGVSDGLLLARYASASLFVVRWGVTEEDEAAAGIEILRAASANVVGSVFSQVDMKKLAAEGYGADYRDKFAAYYAH